MQLCECSQKNLFGAILLKLNPKINGKINNDAHTQWKIVNPIIILGLNKFYVVIFVKNGKKLSNVEKIS